MTSWGWNAKRAKQEAQVGVAWLRPLVAAVPLITVGVLLLMFYLIAGTFTSARGVLFDLPSAGMDEGVRTKLVALVMPKPNETLVFFDDARFLLGDPVSVSAFGALLSERAAKTGERSLLVLADRRVAGGELMKLAGLAKSSGIERILFAERRETEATE